ncbi:MAG: non-heme iron oxygenase ferredoxin subunit [Chloroflexi bacterium]|nr:non-heme iron oxygenase ferredoxin subunit [Chloroflexota bacterium]
MFNYTVKDESECDFVEVASQEDIPPGERIFVQIGKWDIVVFNLAGQYYAIADVCSHDDGPLGDGDVDGVEVVCPRHGARFDLRNGKARALPAVEDIAAFPVKVVGGEIQIGVPLTGGR